jgi:Flp pilus assembly protein TadG
MHRQRRGANAIEFALVLPVLLTILFGTMDYGWYFFQRMGLTEAVSDAARAASVVAQEGNVQSTAQTQFNLTSTAMKVAGTPVVTAASSGVYPNQVVTVTATVPYAAIVGIVPTPPNVSASVTMRREDQPDP